jgi:hypothetical protein
MAVKLQSKQAVSTNLAVQLALNLLMMYVANKISIDIWRSIRGH